MAEGSNPAAGTGETDEVVVQLATAARRYDIPHSTLTHFIRTGQLPAYKLGRTYRVKLADVQALLRPAQPEAAPR